MANKFICKIDIDKAASHQLLFPFGTKKLCKVAMPKPAELKSNNIFADLHSLLVLVSFHNCKSAHGIQIDKGYRFQYNLYRSICTIIVTMIILGTERPILVLCANLLSAWTGQLNGNKSMDNQHIIEAKNPFKMSGHWGRKGMREASEAEL